MHGECFGYSSQNEEARIAFATLNSSNIGQIYFSFEGKLFLGYSPFLANPPDVFADDFSPILHCRIEYGRAYSL